MNYCKVVECMSCGRPIASVRWEKKYHGLRGHCPKCHTDWPES